MKRHVFIDWCKVLGIVLVILGHSYTSPIIHRIIYLFHMPLFFIISGFLYKNKGIKGEMKSSLYALVIPYYIFNAIYLIPLTGGEYKTSYILDILIGNQERLCGLMIPLWFLVSLFVIRVFCTLFEHIGWKHLLCSLLVSIFVFRILGIENGNFDPFQIKTSCFALPFFIIGILMKQHFHSIKAINGGKGPTLAVVMIAVMVFVMLGLYNMYLNNNVTGVFECNYGKYISLYYISTSGIVLGILFLSFLFLNYRWEIIENISNGTLFILCTHLMIKWKIMRFFSESMLSTFFSTVIVLSISYLLILLCQEHFPILLGKKNKKKHTYL